MSGAELTIPGKLSPTALELPGGLTFEDWEAAGARLGEIGRACQWWIGDWLNFGERAYGEKYAQAMEMTGLDYATLADYAYVANNVEPSVRTEGLSWSHHKAVAKLEPGLQELRLEEAATEEWSVAEFRKQLNPTQPADNSRLSLAVPTDWFEALEALAAKAGRTVAEEGCEAIRKHLGEKVLA